MIRCTVPNIRWMVTSTSVGVTTHTHQPTGCAPRPHHPMPQRQKTALPQPPRPQPPQPPSCLHDRLHDSPLPHSCHSLRSPRQLPGRRQLGGRWLTATQGLRQGGGRGRVRSRGVGGGSGRQLPCAHSVAHTFDWKCAYANMCMHTRKLCVELIQHQQRIVLHACLSDPTSMC